MKKIILSGHIIVLPTELDAIKKALPAHIEATRAEQGCITFQVDEHPTETGRFEVYEEFINKAAFERHQQRVKKSTWATATKNITRHYTVKGLEG